MAGFQRLAQCLERAPWEFGQFIQKEDALVGQGDFAGLGRLTAAHQGRHGAAVVGRTPWG